MFTDLAGRLIFSSGELPGLFLRFSAHEYLTRAKVSAICNKSSQKNI